MLRCIRLILVSIIFLFTSSQYLYAVEVNALNYDIYIGDLNGDGAKDYFFKGKPLILILHGDISIPIVIPRDIVDFIIYRDGNNYSSPSISTISPSDLTNKLTNGTLTVAQKIENYTLLSSNVPGQTKLLIKSANVGVPDLLLVSSSITRIPSVSISSSVPVKAVDLGFEYDALGRLIQVKAGGTTKTDYKYDKAGNRNDVQEH